MKKLIVVLGIILSLIAWAQETPVDGRKNSVLKAIHEWDTAYISRDQHAVERLLADDYIGIDHAGEVTRKADEIDLVKKGEYVLLSVEQIEPSEVRFHGTTAIVTSHSNVKLKIKGAQTNLLGRATTVCVERDGQWKIVSWHSSKAR